MASGTTKTDDSDPECETMRIEAEEAMKEIKFAVEFAEFSTKLPQTNDLVYINLRTKEGDSFCVELCLRGFRIVSHQFDTITDTEMSQYYETIYALLDKISPEYRLSFGEALAQRLTQLQNQQQQPQ